MKQEGKILVFSAPSGSGKSTIINYLMSQMDNLYFSISATSRQPRGAEQNGREYYFLTPDQFRQKIEEDAFIEYEEVYQDTFYGTLKSEIERHIGKGHNIILDIDVKGALNVKRLYGQQALLTFIQPPSVEILKERLIKRATDSMDVINNRIKKASYELTFASKFDNVVVNDILEIAQQQVLQTIQDFLARP